MEYLTSTQVADRLGVSTRTVQRMVAKGHLSATQRLPGPNGALLFRPEDVDRIIEKAIFA